MHEPEAWALPKPSPRSGPPPQRRSRQRRHEGARWCRRHKAPRRSTPTSGRTDGFPPPTRPPPSPPPRLVAGRGRRPSSSAPPSLSRQRGPPLPPTPLPFGHNRVATFVSICSPSGRCFYFRIRRRLLPPVSRRAFRALPAAAATVTAPAHAYALCGLQREPQLCRDGDWLRELAEDGRLRE